MNTEELDLLKKASTALEELIEKFDCEKYTTICELEPAKDVVFEIKAILRKAQEK